jgi:hypothetical protein
MSSKHWLLFPFIFVVLVAGWLVGAVALAASPARRCHRHRYHHCTTSSSTTSSRSSSSTTTSPTSTSTTTTSPTSTTSSTTTSSTTSTGAPQPVGVPHPGGGQWTPTFDDEFNGTSLDTSKWAVFSSENDVSCSNSNVKEGGGNLTLTLSSSSTGACVSSAPADGAGSNGYTLPVGGYVEVRAEFPGSGSSIDDWPALWTADRQHWPQSGEVDFAEGLGGLTANYHSPSCNCNSGTLSGSWAGGFHTYAYYRGSSTISVYWDGNLVRSYPRTDDGQGEGIILNIGQGPYGGGSHPGTSLVVDDVRAWK